MAYKVLVVDDEVTVRDLFKDLLNREKCLVKSVSSGEEALDLISKEHFDAVLLDIKLSGISGIETLKKIREVKPDLTVIMTTGFGYDDELISKSMEYGCSGYIGKNMPTSEIMSNFRLFMKLAEEKRLKG